MWTKQLGATDIQIPEIGLGTWNYAGGVGPIRRGVELGAVFIDTAEMYGTEEVVGEAISGIREKVFLATKALPRNFKRYDLLLAAEGSLKQLKTDYIDLYQLHWPNTTVPIAETIGAMEELVDAGKIRFIGVSNFTLPELKRAIRSLKKYRIASNQVHYSLVERTIESGLLEYCQRNQITVIAYSPLKGVVSGLDQQSRSVLENIAAKYDKTAAQVALNWCVFNEMVVTIPKTDKVERVEENCDASDWRLSAEDQNVLNQGIHFHRRSAPERLARRVGRWLYQRRGKGL